MRTRLGPVRCSTLATRWATRWRRSCSRACCTAKVRDVGTGCHPCASVPSPGVDGVARRGLARACVCVWVWVGAGGVGSNTPAAVAIGMVAEAAVARALGHLAPAHAQRLEACLEALGLPTAAADGAVTLADVLAHMALDKKNRRGTKAVVLLGRLGAVVGGRATLVPDSILERVMAPWRRARPRQAAAPG